VRALARAGAITLELMKANDERWSDRYLFAVLVPVEPQPFCTCFARHEMISAA
jgi:hypothetical protein